MTTYTKLDPQPAQRNASDLVRYDKDTAITQSLAWPCPWDCIAAGLYPDEVAYQLDTGDKVAVSVECDWQGDMTGFHAYARWIEDNAASKLLTGKDMEISWSFSLPTTDVNTYGVSAIINDCALMLLGEQTVLEKEAGVPLIEHDPHTTTSIRTVLAVLPNLDGTPLPSL